MKQPGFDLGMKVCWLTNCLKPAVAQTKGVWRCAEHQQEHRHRIAEAANRPRCGCGNMARMGEAVCGACEERQDQKRMARQDLVDEIDTIHEMESIDDIKTYLIDMVMKRSNEL